MLEIHGVNWKLGLAVQPQPMAKASFPSLGARGRPRGESGVNPACAAKAPLESELTDPRGAPYAPTWMSGRTSIAQLSAVGTAVPLRPHRCRCGRASSMAAAGDVRALPERRCQLWLTAAGVARAPLARRSCHRSNAARAVPGAAAGLRRCSASTGGAAGAPASSWRKPSWAQAWQRAAKSGADHSATLRSTVTFSLQRACASAAGMLSTVHIKTRAWLDKVLRR